MSREAEPTYFSVWIALEDMSHEKGGLMLSRPNQVSVGEMSSFNTGALLDHEHLANAGGAFPITIPDPMRSQLTQSMEFIDLSKGEAVAFDSFEPHQSGPNLATSPRLAMKIVYADGTGKSKYLTRVAALEG